MFFFRWVPIFGVEIKLGAIYGNLFRGLPRNIVLLVWVGVITWPLWRTAFFCFLEACWKRIFKVSFRLVTLQLTKSEGWASDITLLFFAGKKKHKKIQSIPEMRKKYTSRLVGLVWWYEMFPNLFFLPVLVLDHQFLAARKKKNLGWQKIHHELQVTVTNPLEIPEINTWSFEHLWLGNFGLLGCPCYEMVRTDQW